MQDKTPRNEARFRCGTQILTVEDDERIRTAVRIALEDEGWAVTEADSGEEALTAFKRVPADVVLIDIMLPGIDGFEVCRSLRKVSDVPIVMVTARSDTHDVVAGLEAGADDYLTKPFAPKELSARIRALLRRTRPTDPEMSQMVFGDLVISPEEGRVLRGDEEVHLTKTEFRLLVELASSQVGCSAGKYSSNGSGATATSATVASSTSTFGACEPRSRPTLGTRDMW